MFTGIVKEIGSISRIDKRGGIISITVNSKEVIRGLNIGDSVAINGVCLTAITTANSSITFDVMEETARRSTLAAMKEGAAVNLEGSMKADGLFGGHFVQGHIDCVGTIRVVGKAGDSFLMNIDVPDGFSDLYVDKGSVTIDGISLTIGECKGDGFNVYLIPHTLKTTTLGFRKSGDRVNVEFDVIGKYIAKAARSEAEPSGRGSVSAKVTKKFLEDKGFI
ncbi:MAG: riboflavin synthase [Candidatus Omnitrophica bacterium]|nr:riboflavin synthase [Candidatus Omnitrophota bacterium]